MTFRNKIELKLCNVRQSSAYIETTFSNTLDRNIFKIKILPHFNVSPSLLSEHAKLRRFSNNAADSYHQYPGHKYICYLATKPVTSHFTIKRRDSQETLKFSTFKKQQFFIKTIHYAPSARRGIRYTSHIPHTPTSQPKEFCLFPFFFPFQLVIHKAGFQPKDHKSKFSPPLIAWMWPQPQQLN